MLHVNQVDDPERPYLYLRVTGAYDLASARQAFVRTYHLMGQHPTGTALLDVRQVTDMPSTIDRFVLGEDVGKLALSHKPGLCLAILGEEPYVEPERFIERVARDRSANLRVFTGEDEAHAWLIGGPSSGGASGPQLV